MAGGRRADCDNVGLLLGLMDDRSSCSECLPLLQIGLHWNELKA